MNESLDISDVARLTGLTSRALRFYEARGLIAPLRTASGRRRYGPVELERLHQILTMKRAGLTIAQIQSMMARPTLDLRSLVLAQIDALAVRQREIATARGLLQSVLTRIDRSEPIDVATFCSLIRQGEHSVSREKWKEITARYMSEEQRAAFRDSVSRMPKDFDGEAHGEKWRDLGRRIKAALPLDPASPQAQAFLAEWDALVQPFLAVSTPEMIEGMRTMNERIEEWEGEIDTPIDAEIYRFHQAAAKARDAMNAAAS